MADVDADPLSPRAYFRDCIDQLRREVEEIRGRGSCQSGDARRLAQAERELAIAEAELASIGPGRDRDDVIRTEPAACLVDALAPIRGTVTEVRR